MTLLETFSCGDHVQHECTVPTPMTLDEPSVPVTMTLHRPLCSCVSSRDHDQHEPSVPVTTTFYGALSSYVYHPTDPFGPCNYDFM